MFVQKLLRNMRVGGASISVFPKRFFACRTKKEMFTSKILKVKSRWKSEVEVENRDRNRNRSQVKNEVEIEIEVENRSRLRSRFVKSKSTSKSHLRISVLATL